MCCSPINYLILRAANTKVAETLAIHFGFIRYIEGGDSILEQSRARVTSTSPSNGPLINTLSNLNSRDDDDKTWKANQAVFSSFGNFFAKTNYVRSLKLIEIYCAKLLSFLIVSVNMSLFLSGTRHLRPQEEILCREGGGGKKIVDWWENVEN